MTSKSTPTKGDGILRRQQADAERKADVKDETAKTDGALPFGYDRFQILHLAAQTGEPAETVVKRAAIYEKYLTEGATT